MTALKEFEKIEATGIWRADQDAQRRDVIVTLGDATLTMFDMQERVLAHWSIPAIARANPGEMPAIFHPDGNPEETLELPDESDLMVEAIEKLRKAVERRRPHPGRLRLTSAIAMIAGVAALGLFWLPGAVRTQTLTALPAIKQREIGAQITEAAERFTGPACYSTITSHGLKGITDRLFPNEQSVIFVVPDGVRDVVVLPGNHYIVGRSLVEDFETPEVLAGYLLAERIRAGGTQAATNAVLETANIFETFRLLTSGDLPQSAADRYAEFILSETRAPLTGPELIPAFEAVQVSTRPYAYSIDVTGESTLLLIESDPMQGKNPPAILSDSAWVGLQSICES